MHSRYDSSRAPSLHTDILHTRGCALGRYDNWPQRWLWTVIPASASMVTPNECEHKTQKQMTCGEWSPKSKLWHAMKPGDILEKPHTSLWACGCWISLPPLSLYWFCRLTIDLFRCKMYGHYPSTKLHLHAKCPLWIFCSHWATTWKKQHHHTPNQPCTTLVQSGPPGNSPTGEKYTHSCFNGYFRQCSQNMISGKTNVVWNCTTLSKMQNSITVGKS